VLCSLHVLLWFLFGDRSLLGVFLWCAVLRCVCFVCEVFAFVDCWCLFAMMLVVVLFVFF